jgi:hypothetical protein
MNNKFDYKINILIESLFRQLLHREGSNDEIAFKYKSYLEHHSLDQLIKDFLDSPEAYIQSLNKEHLLQHYFLHHNGIDARSTVFPRLQTTRNLGIVFVPNDHFLPFCLAVADKIYEKYHIESVLVYLHWSPAIHNIFSLSQVVYEVIDIAFFGQIIRESAFEPKFIAVHSWGWLDQSRWLISLFPKAYIYQYADGFGNGIDHLIIEEYIDKNQIIRGSFFFGYKPYHHNVNRIESIIPITNIFSYMDEMSKIYKISDQIRPPFLDWDNYAVLYLRYWDKGTYSMPLDMIVEIIRQTIAQVVGTETTILIKDDPRVASVLMGLVSQQLQNDGYKTASFGEYLQSFNIDSRYQQLPTEYFFSYGFLSRANLHFTLDGSLSYILAAHPSIRRPTELILGADFSTVDHTILHNIPVDAVSSPWDVMQFHLNKYATAILHDTGSVGLAVLIQETDGVYYRIQLESF